MPHIHPSRVPSRRSRFLEFTREFAEDTPTNRVRALSCVLAMHTAWAAHVIGTELGDPLGVEFDFWLAVGLATILRAAAWLATMQLVAWTYARIAGDRGGAIRAFARAAVSGVVLTIGLAVWRDPLAAALSNDTWMILSVEHPSWMTWIYDRWLPRWQSGEVLGLECACALVVAGVNALLGFRFGRHAPTALFLGWVSTFLIVQLYVYDFHLLVSDADFADLSIWSGSLAFDLWLPVAMDPVATIGCFVQATIVGVCLSTPRR